MNDYALIFFLAWMQAGAIYFGIKTGEEVYKNENCIGKALTIFLSGPFVWALFICEISVRQIGFLNKKNRSENVS